MPTYEFRCPAGHDFERFFGRISSAPAEVECPECGALAHRRISGGAGLVFKGSGFYITDYGKDGKKDQKPAVKSDGAKSDGAKSDGAKSDAARGGESGGGSGGGAKPEAGKSDAAPAKPDAGSGAAKPAAPPKPAGGA